MSVTPWWNMPGPCKSPSRASHHHTSPTCHGTQPHPHTDIHYMRSHLESGEGRPCSPRDGPGSRHQRSALRSKICPLCVCDVCGRHEVLTCLDDDEGIQAEVPHPDTHPTPHCVRLFPPCPPYLSACVMRPHVLCSLSLPSSFVLGGVSDVSGHPPCHDRGRQAPHRQGSTRHTRHRQVTGLHTLAEAWFSKPSPL